MAEFSRSVRKRWKPSQRIDQYECNVQFTGCLIRNINMKEERLICFVGTILVHSLPSIYLPINRTPNQSEWSACFSLGSKTMDTGKRESNANDTHSCTKHMVRVHCSHSNEMCTHVFLSIIFELIGAFLPSRLTFGSHVFIFTKGNTLIIDIWSQ